MKYGHFTLLFILAFSSGIITAQFSWEHTDGPFGSVLSSIYSNDQYAFIPEDDFLYRSTDGLSWEKIDHPVSFIMFVYQDTLLNILYNEDADSLRLQLSYDNGITWVVKDLPEDFNVSDDIVMTTHGIYLSQGNNDLLFRSTDLGDTWDNIAVPQEFHTLETHENRLYIYGSSALWRTDTDGQNWEDVTPPLPLSYYVDDVAAKGSHLLVTSSKHLFHSHDNGQSWETSVINSGNANNKLTLVGDQVYLSATFDLLRTNDFGWTWDSLTNTFNGLDMVTATGLNDLYLSTTFNKGVYRWDETADALIESNDGFSKGYVYDLAVGDNKIWAACGNGVFAYDVPTETWSEKMNLPLPVFEFDFISANDHGWVLVCQTLGDEFYLSDNNGFTWDTILLPGNGIYSINKMHLVGDILYLVADYYLFRSTDMGLNWDYVDVGFVNTDILSANGILYMADSDSLYSSTDSGVSWDAVQPPIGIEYLFEFADVLYAMAYNQDYDIELYTSEDGVQWTYVSDGFPKEYSTIPTYGFSSAIIFRDAIHHYCFLGWEGHYTAPNASMLWSELSTSQTGNSYVIHDDVIYLGGQGVYKSTIENPYITAVEDIHKDANELFTIFPNPADDFIQVTITDVEVNGEIKFSLYNSKGDHVKSQTSNSAENIRLDIQGLPSGIYLLQARTSGSTEVAKFVKN